MIPARKITLVLLCCTLLLENANKVRSTLHQIQNEARLTLWSIIDNDKCVRGMSSLQRACGSQEGNVACREALKNFAKLPAEERTLCMDVKKAECRDVPGTRQKARCSFHVKRIVNLPVPSGSRASASATIRHEWTPVRMCYLRAVRHSQANKGQLLPPAQQPNL